MKDDGLWDLSRIRNLHQISVVVPPLLDDGHDHIYWAKIQDGCFTTKSAFMALTQHNLGLANSI